MNYNLLPNFFLIGTSKSASTSLYVALNRHPQVFMSDRKEPNFFNYDERYAKGIAWYQEFFTGAEGYPARGEASVRYLDRSPLVVPRLQALYGERPLRFMAIFRDPVQRAYSGYWQARRDGTESLPFAEAIAAEAAWMQAHPGILVAPEQERKAFHIGRYATHLKPFLACYPRESFLFLLQEDLLQDYGSAMRKVYAFIGVDPDFVPPLTHSNPAALPRSRVVADLLKNPTGIKALFKRLLPQGLFKPLGKFMRRANLRSIQYPPMDPALEQELRRRYFDEIKELEGLIERDLSGWYPQ